MKRSEAYALRAQMETTFEKATPNMTGDEVIQSRVLCKPWKPGKHSPGEVYTAEGQPWSCYQAYDNTVYPGIVPGSAAWPTFNKPYHGTTPETALPFVQPTHSQDIYKAGEYMVYTNGFTYKAVLDTAFSPEENPSAWEVV